MIVIVGEAYIVEDLKVQMKLDWTQLEDVCIK
jgi:hypothetical protein